MKYFATFLLVCAHCGAALPAHAQHLRIFACAIANDSAGAFLGGSSNGSGLYQSDDTGKTWKHLGWNNIKCYSMDMVRSSNGRILYMATGLGVLRSTDYGEHWKQITDWRVSEVMGVTIDQKSPTNIYLATAHGGWQSSNAGKTWFIPQSQSGRDFSEWVHLDSVESGKPTWLHDNDEPTEADQRIVISLCCDDTASEETVRKMWGQRINVVGTLREGVFIYDSPDDHRTTLPHRQIWSIEDFLVTP